MDPHPPSGPPAGRPDAAPEAAPKSSLQQQREERTAAWADNVKKRQDATSAQIRNPVAEPDPTESVPDGAGGFDVNLLFTNSARLAAEEQTRRDAPDA